MLKVTSDVELREELTANIATLKHQLSQHKAKLRRCKRMGIRCKDKTSLLRKELEEEKAKLDRLNRTDTYLYYEGKSHEQHMD